MSVAVDGTIFAAWNSIEWDGAPFFLVLTGSAPIVGVLPLTIAAASAAMSATQEAHPYVEVPYFSCVMATPTGITFVVREDGNLQTLVEHLARDLDSRGVSGVLRHRPWIDAPAMGTGPISEGFLECRVALTATPYPDQGPGSWEVSSSVLGRAIDVACTWAFDTGQQVGTGMDAATWIEDAPDLAAERLLANLKAWPDRTSAMTASQNGRFRHVMLSPGFGCASFCVGPLRDRQYLAADLDALAGVLKSLAGCITYGFVTKAMYPGMIPMHWARYAAGPDRRHTSGAVRDPGQTRVEESARLEPHVLQYFDASYPTPVLSERWEVDQVGTGTVIRAVDPAPWLADSESVIRQKQIVLSEFRSIMPR